MMKKRGRFIAGFAALMMAVMLTGCGGSKYEEVVATTATVEATAKEEPTRQTVVLETESEKVSAAESTWEPEERIEVDGKIRSYLTGEMVEITVEKGKGMVERILPRKNSFVRPAVANVDALVIFAANVNPVTEPFLIDRVAAIAGDQEVQVVICVNKCDLDPGLDLARIYRNAGFTVIQTSAETGEGVEVLRAVLQGKLAAFTGNSGVGKSSVLNRLCPDLGLATGEVSEKLGRGRHTTRHVELYKLDEETYVADTPGFSSFDTDQMEVILKENLQFAFPDFAPHIGTCLFRDCTHRKEPGCAVRAALDAGQLEPTRYDSYLRLYEKASQIKEWELK